MAASLEQWLHQVELTVVPHERGQRYTQDSPIYYDVWMAYAEAIALDRGDARLDLLLAIHRQATAAEAAAALRERLREDAKPRENSEKKASSRSKTSEPPAQFDLSFNESHVVVKLLLAELVRAVLPLTNWWQARAFGKPPADSIHRLTPSQLQDKPIRRRIAELIPRQLEMDESGEEHDGTWYTPDLVWLAQVVGMITLGPQAHPAKPLALVDAFLELLQGISTPTDPRRPLIWSVSRNRPVELSLERSTVTAKADAARMVFRPDCSKLTWAVVDTGIDVAHIAFRKRQAQDGKKYPTALEKTPTGRIENNTRIRAVYDFTRVRSLLSVPVLDAEETEDAEQTDDVARGLRKGRILNWSEIEPKLRVEYDPSQAEALVPGQEHGTHVAGTIAGEWRKLDDPPAPKEVLEGMCPSLELFDFRVFDNEGRGDEYGVLAALQFVRFLNSSKDQPVIHGVNLSLSLRHDAFNFACGSTPICAECERLVGSGVVVVAAAGNLGYARFQTERGERSDGTRMASITDPGNAELVITVGSTHRTQPHRYGVSYFSSRGPTSDGRYKPDLVAPGEKIVAPTPGNKSRSMDGTSMAAPHVSGAAAMLMARYPELIGRPDVIKKILMSSATDLGRERYFQGAGLVDVLRALQSV